MRDRGRRGETERAGGREEVEEVGVEGGEDIQ